MEPLEREVAIARAAGRRLGPFVLLGELGRGGMGVVLRAWDERRGALVALKLLDPALADPDAAARLAREGRAVGALDHPGVVRLLDAGELEGRPFVALELVHGAPFGERLPPRGDLDLRGAVRVLRDVAAALAHAHERGVVHRDLKPSNVLVTASGEGRLIDFGLARLALDRQRLTTSGTLLGTPGFMAPEQANGQGARAGPPADVWGLGALLYLALTGRPPFVAASVLATLRAIMEDAPDPLVAARDEPELASLTLACLAKEEADRPAAREVARALSGWLGPARPRARFRRGRARRLGPAALAALVAGAALVAAAGAVHLARPSTTPAPPLRPPPPAPPEPESEAAPVVSAFERAPLDVTASLDERLLAALAADELGLAAELLEPALARWPDDPTLLCARANVRWRRMDPAGARRDAERAVEVAPDEAGGRCVLGVVCSAQGQRARAALELDRAVSLAAASGDRWLLRQARMSRARARRRVGATAGALEDTGAVLAVDPSDRLAIAERAQALLETGRTAEAWALCEPLMGRPQPLEPTVAPGVIRCAIGAGDTARAGELLRACRGPKSPGLWLARADLAFATGDLISAEAGLLRAIALDPGDAVTWTVLACVRARAGDGPGTLQAAEVAEHLGVTSAALWNGLALDLLGADRVVESLRAVERCLALDPHRPDGQLRRVELLLRLGEVRAAEARAAALVRDDPERLRSWAVLAVARTRLGDLAGAEEALRGTLERVAQADAVDPLLLAATAELALARPDRAPEAQAAIDDLLRQRPELPDGHHLAARLRLGRGDAAGAAELATRALDLPSAPRGGILGDPWSVRARARVALGQLDLALADADEAVLRRPHATEAFAARAEAHRARGDLARAEADLARSRALDGGRP